MNTKSMDTKYVILKSMRVKTGDPFSRPFEVTAGARDLPVASPDFSIEINELQKKELAERSHDVDVAAIAPVMRMKLIEPHGTTNAEKVQHTDQGVTWGVKAIGADTSPFTGDGIVVAVLDTGIDAAHPAFKGVDLIQKDFTGEGNGDQNGHGTHCAGTIFGRSVNGMRIGVAPGVKKALIGKVLGKTSGGSSDQICDAIQWAIDNGANVISMSLGMDFPGYVADLKKSRVPEEVAVSIALEGYRKNVSLFEKLAALIKASGAFSQAALITAAAGNESYRESGQFWEIAVSPPAVADGIVSVGALRKGAEGLNVAWFSNTGANISAPGVDILSAWMRGDMKSLSGTSMATPHIAGAAALWAEKLKRAGSLTGALLTAKLIGSGTSRGFEAGFDPLDVGAGIVQCPQD